MTVTLVIPSSIEQELVSVANHSDETAGVLLASLVRTAAGGIRLLAREMHWVDPSAYLTRSATELSVASSGYVAALSRAEVTSACALWVHTHPGANLSPRPSSRDRIVDAEISEVFRIRTGSEFYGAVIFSPSAESISFTGHLDPSAGSAMPIDRVWIVGDRLRLLSSYGAAEGSLSPALDRNVRAFGPAVQRTLSQLAVGVVGLGGTGSSVAEQLVRLGVREILLIDPDTLSDSNVTRVYGSRQSDVGNAKVDVAAASLNAIAEEVRVEAFRGTITSEAAARRLSACDVVFGCTDDNAGRLILSRIATYFLVPVIDCGVVISSSGDGTIVGVDGRVTVLGPGAACLLCRGRIDVRRAAAEMMPADEHARLVEEGYAPALGAIEPAVVAFTTAVGAAAVAELLERLIGYGATPRPTEVLLRMHEREISTNRVPPRHGHYCHAQSGKIGVGNTSPFLDQVWPA